MNALSQQDPCSSPKSDVSQSPEIPEPFRISLIVEGHRHCYDIRYLYGSVIKNSKDPYSGHLFTNHQLRRITAAYRQRVDSTR